MDLAVNETNNLSILKWKNHWLYARCKGNITQKEALNDLDPVN